MRTRRAITMVAARRRAWLVGSVETSSMVERAAINKVVMGDHKVAMEDHKAAMASNQGMVAHNEVIRPPRRDIEHPGARAWTIFPLDLRRWMACKDRSY